MLVFNLASEGKFDQQNLKFCSFHVVSTILNTIVVIQLCCFEIFFFGKQVFCLAFTNTQAEEDI